MAVAVAVAVALAVPVALAVAVAVPVSVALAVAVAVSEAVTVAVLWYASATVAGFHLRCVGAGCLLALLTSSCSEAPSEPAGPRWGPGTTYASERAPSARGFVDRRGVIHAHSVYSHDACDGQPRDGDGINEACFADFRHGLCNSRHDFVMLTDHPDAFAETPFPDVLLYRPGDGDQLVERDGRPVASWLACPDGARALVMAGLEGGTMPVGIERHVEPDAARDVAYSRTSSTAIAALEAVGAVVLVAHTEDWSADDLVQRPIGGFEMYNLHANALTGAGPALEILYLNSEGLPGLPHPELVIVPIWNEDERYLSRWGSVLSRGVERTTVMGTDCHQNTFAAILPDGDRGDSYRRVMPWFSNHLLIEAESDGSWDDRHLKDALREGRVYGAFEALGYPVGFDYHAESDGSITEMGQTVALSSSPALKVVPPTVRDLDPSRPAPTLRTRLLLAKDGGFEEVGTSTTDGLLTYAPIKPGAYRAEVRMAPHHLAADLGNFEPDVLATEPVWIYANAIYVR